MPIQFVMDDSACVEMVVKVLTLVSKFSRKAAYIKLGSTSVTVIWKQSNSGNIWARVENSHMFSSSPNFRNPHRDHIVIMANPSTLARLFKGAAQQNKRVTINIYKDLGRMRIIIDPNNNIASGNRTVTHTLAITHQNSEACSALQLDDLRQDNNYDTRATINELYRVRHIMERFLALEPQRIYIWSRQGGDITFRSETQGSNIIVSVSDLENGFSEDEDTNLEFNRREEAGVFVETKKLSTFLTFANPSKRAKVKFEVAHNKKLRLTIEHEKYHIMFVLPHNLN